MDYLGLQIVAAMGERLNSLFSRSKFASAATERRSRLLVLSVGRREAW